MKTTPIKNNNFEKLVRNISCVHEVLQAYASKSVNQFLDFGQDKILRSLSAKLQIADNENSTILRSLTAKSSEIMYKNV